MSKVETFPNAPITEALMDIQVRLPTGFNAEVLEEFHKIVKDKYSESKSINIFETKIDFNEKTDPDIEQSKPMLLGYAFKSVEEKKIIQIRINGFTFNKLKPYESWEKFFSEGREFWERYVEFVKPSRVKRIALRYINRIEIPLPINDFEEYILTNPRIAPKLPQALSQYFMRLEIPHPDLNSLAIITQTLGKQVKQNSFPLIFDIDVIIESEYNIGDIKMWADFEKLREFKNKIFIDSMTEKAKEMFR